MEPFELSASGAAVAIREGRLSVEELARSCLEQVAARDVAVKAWLYVDPAAVLRRARELDKTAPRSALHGIPVGIKDMIDTADMPTTHNSPLFEGHRPGQDAAVVSTLRAAGALVFGKTDTTEFAAAGRWAATRNPFDAARTPGGSSAGSAAAVADRQVPLALGTQTGGSTIRPASFCGVFALKPTWGVVSREGVKLYSATLDTVSWFARDIDDLGLMCDVLDVQDDAAAHEMAAKGMRVGVCRSPAWGQAGEGTKAAMARAADAMGRAGAVVSELALPDAFEGLGQAQHLVMHGEGRAAFLNLARSRPEGLHDDFHARVENREGITRAALAGAYDLAARCRVEFDGIAAGYDAVLTPSAIGEAPVGHSPGDAVFNRMWTLLHVPCVNLPGYVGEGGMPVGVTLTGPRFTDRRLLAAAKVAGPVVAAG